MRSLRLDADLDEKVQRAAAIKGESVSEFIRHAAATRADETLGEPQSGRFSDVAGAVHGGGGRARKSGEAFAKALANGRTRR